MTHKQALKAYSRQLEVEKDATVGSEKQLEADQGYAMRLVVAHGFLAVADELEKIGRMIYVKR